MVDPTQEKDVRSVHWPSSQREENVRRKPALLGRTSGTVACGDRGPSGILGDVPPMILQAAELLDAFIAALRDEVAAAKSAKGDSITSLTDGRRTQQGADHATYTFLMERSVTASDDVPVELEVGGRRYKGSVLYVNGDELVLVVNTTQDLGAEIAHAGLVTNLAFLPQRLKERLELVRDGEESADMSLATQAFSPQAAPAQPDELPELPAMGPGLEMNPSRRRAVQGALGLPVSFVWGPPGTGKTATLARIAEAFLRQGQRVLVVAHSNVAVDEAAADIAALLRDTPWYQNYEILRLGHHRNDTLEQYDRILFDQYAEVITCRLGSDRHAVAEAQRLVVERARIVCTTLTGTFFSSVFPETPFDVCLVDEASMASLPYLFWALSRAKQHTALCGDFLQLPPVALAQTSAARRWLGRNIYQHLDITAPDHARDDPRVFLLNTQYRMHPRIAEIPNRLFYDGVLSSDPGTAARPGAGANPLVLVDTSDAGAWCVRLARGSRLNLHSAHVAATLAQRLAGTPPKAGQVAIITPYAAQARLLGAFIRDLGLARTVRVATVHRFQGGEMPTLIFDTVEAPPERPAPMLDNTRDPGASLLLNVALTRAQRTEVLIAHATFIQRILEDESALLRITEAFTREASRIPSQVITEGADTSWTQFETDVASSAHELVAIFPAGLDGGPAGVLLDQAKQRGVRLTIHDGKPPTQDPSMDGDDGTVTSRLPRPLIVVDRRVIWDGCPNPDNSTPPKTAARRIASARAASALVHAVATSSHPDDTDGAHYREVLTTQEGCPRCGGLLRATVGAEYVTLICERASECGYKRRLRKHDRIPTDRSCPACGQPMIMRVSNYGPAYLSCHGYPTCKKTVTLGQRAG